MPIFKCFLLPENHVKLLNLVYVTHIIKYLLKNPRYRFSDNFDISKMHRTVATFLPNELKINDGYLANSYIFKYNGCGFINDKLVNYFRVVALVNTNNITTMHPYENRERLPYIDLNLDLNLDDCLEIKNSSQVDKFIKRYKKDNN